MLMDKQLTMNQFAMIIAKKLNIVNKFSVYLTV
jgi:hypothetical protein